MAKKKQQAYDKEAMKILVFEINNIRRPLKDKMIARIYADVEKLEKAVKMLPKKDREIMEKFWGLIPGTINHSKRINSSKAKDVAYESMKEETLRVIKKLLTVEYLHIYDPNVESLYNQILSKINREGAEEVSDIDAIKYLILLRVFIEGGQRLFYEKAEYPIDLTKETGVAFDDYMLLKVMYEKKIAYLPYGSINLRLLIEIVSLFDTKDVAVMKKFARLPINKDEDTQEKIPENFAGVRIFKERIFLYGPWNIATSLVYGNEVKKEDVEELKKYFNLFRADFGSVWNLKKGNTISLKSSRGTKTVPSYQIGELEFSDIDELVSLYVCKSII